MSIKGTLNQFSKDRSPSPDGWTTESFVGFFDLVGEDLLKVFEDSKIHDYVPRVVNATCIALIPKSAHPKGFKEFRIISLCNVVYNLISKTIANRLSPFLSSSISNQ